jgi:type IV pilus assembly protein PilN
MQQLRSVLSQVQKFEASKAQLQQRVTLIALLRRGQSGPVHILDEINKAVPERLWLTDLTEKGDDIVLAGMTTSFSGLSDFVANLESSKWFKKPVDIVDSQVIPDAKTGDIFKFSIKAVFNNPEAPPPPVAIGARGRGSVPAKK